MAFLHLAPMLRDSVGIVLQNIDEWDKNIGMTRGSQIHIRQEHLLMCQVGRQIGSWEPLARERAILDLGNASTEII